MELIPLKSERIQSGSELQSALVQALKQNGSKFVSGDLLVIASKVVAYSQGLLRNVDNQESFKALIHEEADQVLDEGDMVLTMKNNILIPNAGIDNSNTPEGEVILWPEKPFEAARSIRQGIMSEFDLEEFGVVISDSHCQPLRMGTSGIAIGWDGFEGVQDERGAKDLFGREMVYTKIAVADNLSSAANLLMGETDASIPFVIVRNLKVNFTEEIATEKDYFIGPDKCIYNPLYSSSLSPE